MMMIDNKFEFGDIVYLIADREQEKRIVCQINVMPNGLLLYQVASGGNVSDHYDFELSREEDTVLKTQ